ncbi:MAG TPA: HAD-IB family phosphatase [Thermoplasmata archaeon]|nr:HAD-IB family phosphatase [Thermoplasmata archaeon]
MAAKLVAFDMDGTLVDVMSSWAEVHRHFGESNSEALDLFVHDRIDDMEFIRRDIALWWKHDRELTSAAVDEILAQVPLMPGAAELFEALHRKGVATAIVSGGIDLLAHRVARKLDIPHVYANGFQVDDRGRLTGEGIVRVPIKHKGRTLRALQHELGIPKHETASVGNSDIDVQLFRESKTGIAFLPADDTVREHATRVVAAHDLSECIPYLLEE